MNCPTCGAATRAEDWHLCPKCDREDLKLAFIGDRAAITERLNRLRWDLDVRRQTCPRCSGFGAVEFPGGAGLRQNTSGCVCSDGKLVAQGEPSEARPVLKLKKGPVKATVLNEIWIESEAPKCADKEKLVQRVARQFLWGETQARSTVEDMIRRKILVVHDTEAGRSETLFGESA